MKGTLERVKKDAEGWAKSNPSAVKEMVRIANEMLKDGASIHMIAATMPDRSKDFREASPSMVEEILKPYVDAHHYISDKVSIFLTDDQKKMIAELGVDSKEFVSQLVEWYRTDVFNIEKEKETEIEKETNEHLHYPCIQRG